jgi:hypothetical protein
VEFTTGANSGRNRSGGDLEDEERFKENCTSLVQRGIFCHSAAKYDETGE